MSELEESALLSDIEDNDVLGSSTLEESMENTDFFKTVNKYDCSWEPTCLFNGFNCRVVFKSAKGQCLLERDSKINRIKKKLERDLGQEEEDWFILENQITHEEELYMVDQSLISMWFLRDPASIKDIFEVVMVAEDS